MINCLKTFILIGLISIWMQGGCAGIPNEPLPQLSCPMQEAFGKDLNIVSLSKGQTYKLFQKGGEEYGCMGIVWAGQTGTPPHFVTLLKQDGSYLVYDPATKQPVTQDKVGANIAPGVREVDVLLFIYDIPAKDAPTMDCASLVKAGIAGCWANTSCLFVLHGAKIPLDRAKGNGSCRVCQRELCNGKDDNCDLNGEIDEVTEGQNPCGKILNVGCGYADKPVTSQTSGCDGKQGCKCLVYGQQVYVCAGSSSDNVQWMPIDEATKQCNKEASETSAKYSCGNMPLICDLCDGNYSWRSSKAGCPGGVMRYSR